MHLDLVKIPPLRAGLIGLFSQNLILMGVFFTIPLYLQLVLGLDALETGVKMLPTSIAMFVAAAVGSRLATRYSVRAITRAGLATTAVAAFALLATIQPDLADLAFAVSMAHPRRRDGADRVAARPRGPVVGRCVRPRARRAACSTPASSSAPRSASPSSGRSSWSA